MAGYYDFTVDRGTTFKRTLGWRVGGLPVDITGFAATMELRKKPSQSAPDYVLTSDKNGGIVVGDANGRIDITATPDWTKQIVSGIYFYFIDVNGGKEITRLLEGRVTVKDGGTQ